MRHALAVTFAAAALAVTLVVPAFGAVCGSRQVSESCFSAADCDAKARCVSDVHPLSWPFVGLGVVGLVGAVVRRRDVVLGAAVAVGALSTLLGLSIGSIEIYAAAILVAAGFALPPRDARDRRLAWAALGAILLAVPIFSLVGALARVGFRSHAFAWLAFFAPAIVWLALALAGGREKKRGASP